jgi:hypothetical protein
MSTESTSSQTAVIGTRELVAYPGSYYRATRLLMVFILIGYGIWSINDGFRRWPEENRTAIQVAKDRGQDPKPPHSDLDIKLNQGLGILLPPLGIFLLVWAMYHSRGTYRLTEGVLYVPGHPPIPLDHIQAVDKTRWDRKGLAVVDYETTEGKKGRFTIDDYAYDREATDAIFDKIEAVIRPDADKARGFPVINPTPAPARPAAASPAPAPAKPAAATPAPAPAAPTTPRPAAAPPARPAPPATPPRPGAAPAAPAAPRPTATPPRPGIVPPRPGIAPGRPPTMPPRPGIIPPKPNQPPQKPQG